MQLKIKKKKRADKSKVAALIRNNEHRLPKNMVIMVNDNAPESIRTTGRLPGAVGWKIIRDFPLMPGSNKKDYLSWLLRTAYREIWIKLATNGGRSVVYVR